MKKLVVVAMIFLLGTAWWSTIDNFGVKKAEYRQHIAAAEKYEKQQETKKLLETMKGQEDITLDGKKMLLYCNIGSPEDVAAVLANDGQGIGLFRSEFLYLSASDYPTEDEQFEAYRSVATAMNGKRVVIRTLDIGADKQVDYFDMKEEENPALGVRAIRICLNRPEVFRTQLRSVPGICLR